MRTAYKEPGDVQQVKDFWSSQGDELDLFLPSRLETRDGMIGAANKEPGNGQQRKDLKLR
jgi:hypothetical protein